ncbi:MAG: hypothetical protein JWN04_942, partial [Myxococcaceae bacterium]|nr:hypothetical protein [Myxococcaceae bacterium]
LMRLAPDDLDQLLQQYDRDHQHPLNRRLHLVGITLIGAASLTVWFLPPLALTLFAAGWSAQLLGHAVEGKPPSFSRDRRFLVVGAVWYARELRALVSRSLSARV